MLPEPPAPPGPPERVSGLAQGHHEQVEQPMNHDGEALTFTDFFQISNLQLCVTGEIITCIAAARATGPVIQFGYWLLLLVRQ